MLVVPQEAALQIVAAGGALSLGSMAGVRLKVLLVVLAWILRLVSVQAWDPIDEYKLYKYYETGEWTEPRGLISPGNLL